MHYTTASVQVLGLFFFQFGSETLLNVQKTNEKETLPKCQRAALGKIHKAAQTETETHSSCLCRTCLAHSRDGAEEPSRSAANTLGTKCKYGRNKDSGSGPPCLLLMLNRWTCFRLIPARLLGNSATPLSPSLSLSILSCLSVTLSPPAWARPNKQSAGETTARCLGCLSCRATRNVTSDGDGAAS